MPFVPEAVGHTDLKYPEDRCRLWFLSQKEKEAWYAAQDPMAMVQSNKDFERFWARCYGWHVGTKRFFFRFKFW